jgi:predicted transcriptional regulator
MDEKEHIRLDRKLHSELKVLAYTQGKTLTTIANEAISKFLKQEKLNVKNVK